MDDMTRQTQSAPAQSLASDTNAGTDTDTGDTLEKRQTLIEVDAVGLTLAGRAGSVEILKSVSLTIFSGETLAIVGPSGSGKTSLLMVMAGLEPVTLGQVTVAGQGLSALGEDELAKMRRAHIGIVFQSFHLVPAMTALENVMLPLEFSHSPNAENLARAALDQVGLAHRLGHYPAELSGGEQQRVALARALAPRPRILLADEPTGNLDEKTGAEITQLMFDLRAKYNMTLVLVTHDPKLAKKCSRTINITDGHLGEQV